MVVQFLPAHRVVALLESLTGAAPSVGFVHGMLARTARLLAQVHNRIADALRGLIHQANLARHHGLDAIAHDAKTPLLHRFHHGVLAGLSETRSHGDRPGETKARNLLEVLHDRPADVLRFTGDLKVPPTSNQAERDLRPSKVQQDTSGRLTSEERTRDRYTIRGYLSTAIKHGHDAITILRDALTGHPWMPAPPAPT